MPTETEFPQAKIVAALDAWWEDEKLNTLERAAELPPVAKGGDVSILAPIGEIDSNRTVEALLEIEPILGIPIPPRLVKLGGYTSYDEMKDHLLAGLKALYHKKMEKVDA